MRIQLLLTLFLVLSPPLWAEGVFPSHMDSDSLNVRLICRWPYGPSYAVAADTLRELLFLGSGGGIYVLDISDPANPIRISQIPTPGRVEDIVYQDNFLYIADYSEGLRIISVADAINPYETGSVYAIRASAVAVDGAYAYLADQRIIRVVSVSDPTNPEEVAQINLGMTCYGLETQGSYLYQATTGGLVILSIADPQNPFQVGRFDPPTAGSAMDVAVRGDYAYLAVYSGSSWVVLISDPENPVGVTSFQGWVQNITLRGMYAYCVNWIGSFITIVSIEDPNNPNEIVDFHTPGTAYQLTVRDSIAFIADGPRGLTVFSVSDPEYPVEIGYYKTPDTASEITIIDSLAYIADGSAGLLILSISDPRNPVMIGSLTTPYPVDNVAVEGNYAFLGQSPYGGPYGIRIVSIADPETPEEVSFFQTPGSVTDLVTNGSNLLATLGGIGLKIISVVDPVNPVEIGSYSTPGSAFGVDVRESYAYVTAWLAGLRVISISDPTHPEEVGFYDDDREHEHIDVNGDYAYVTLGGEYYRGLRIYSITDPSNPSLIGYANPHGTEGKVTAGNDNAYIASGVAGLRVMDIGDPNNPWEAGHYNTSGQVCDPEIAGTYVYVANGELGILVIEYLGTTSIEDSDIWISFLPKSFELSQNYPNPFNPSTNIKYSVPVGESLPIHLDIFDLRGRFVRNLVKKEENPGHYTVNWDGRDERGQEVNSGTYLYRIKVGDFSSTKKMTILR